jgi:hypothetical protein
LKKNANPQAFTKEYFVYTYFSLKFSHFIGLEAKCVGNWNSEPHWWALQSVKETKLCIYRPCLLDMGTAKDPHLSQRSAVDQ